ncbi:MAG TPA: glucoamylase family protein, partial [Acidobacteriota bacterium]
WRYFDTFVTEEDHWLPPDNFQEVPKEILAHRTSPTNISFSLLANLVAYDFGYIGLTGFLERTERSLNTLTRLNTFNGHLYNWYNTRTLEPLEPRYVSTVDSGNLAATLIVLKQFALNYPRTDPPFHKRIQGVTDTLRKMLERAKQAKAPNEQYRVIRELISFLRRTTGSEDQEDLLRWLNRVVLEMKPDASADTEYGYWWSAVDRTVASHLTDYQRPQDLKRRLLSLARECEELVREMDFRFLFDESRGLFSIGFNVTNGRLDTSYYDLLASEARLASFIAIAKGDVPQSHWFRMSRIATAAGGERVLASWSGSMFEYLLPCLFLRSDKHTLLEETYEKAIRLQQRYGRARKIPWGMSEAAFHSFDIASNYQYGPFGVPWLGLKRGLGASLVVAPYATFLCALLYPNLAARNLEALQRLRGSGRFGFYESIDFTRAHIPETQEFA